MSDATGHGKGNSLSPEPCVLSPDLGSSIHRPHGRGGGALATETSLAIETATMDGASPVVHWWFGSRHPTNADDPGAGGICDEFAIGDWVLDETIGTQDQVTCDECLEWIHA